MRWGNGRARFSFGARGCRKTMMRSGGRALSSCALALHLSHLYACGGSGLGTKLRAPLSVPASLLHELRAVTLVPRRSPERHPRRGLVLPVEEAIDRHLTLLLFAFVFFSSHLTPSPRHRFSPRASAPRSLRPRRTPLFLDFRSPALLTLAQTRGRRGNLHDACVRARALTDERQVRLARKKKGDVGFHFRSQQRHRPSLLNHVGANVK